MLIFVVFCLMIEIESILFLTKLKSLTYPIRHKNNIKEEQAWNAYAIF